MHRSTSLRADMALCGVILASSLYAADAPSTPPAASQTAATAVTSAARSSIAASSTAPAQSATRRMFMAFDDACHGAVFTEALKLIGNIACIVHIRNALAA
jgi:hypothetical protein